MTTFAVAEAPAQYVVAPEGPEPYRLTPVRLALLTALRMAYGEDAAALRAIGRLEEAMGEGKVLVTAFDGHEGRVLSVSRGQNVEHVFTTSACTCEGSRHPWHIHPLLFRLLLAEWAISDPGALLDMLAVSTPPAPPAPPAAAQPWANDRAYLEFSASEYR